MTDQSPTRSIELAVEVAGTPEEVWRAIATGPGISAWFVSTQVEPRQGGALSQDFGNGQTVEGVVARWEPPTAFAYGPADTEGPDGAMFFEFFVETADGGGSVVRLVNSGFGTGDGWDDQYDAMTEGWKLFLHNLQRHLANFAGQRCETIMVNGLVHRSREEGWQVYATELGVPAAPAVGDRVVTTGLTPPVAGTVTRVTPTMLTLLAEDPAPGVVCIMVEGVGAMASTSLFAYLYGPEASPLAGDGSPWSAWMEKHFPTPTI